MKLLSLDADRPEFRTVHFRKGLSLILGDSPGDAVEGSSNGVGKTLALGLVHHCLGATTDPRLARAVPDWVFALRFQLDDGEHLVERTGNGRSIAWDEEQLSLARLRNRLNEVGPFSLAEAPRGVTFRSLLSRFARHKPEDCQDPVRTKSEQDSDALLRVAFLLGLDTTLIENKISLKQQLDQIDARNKLIASNETYISELLRMRREPAVRLNSLSDEIAAVESNLRKLKVADDYRSIEEQADVLTREMRDLGQEVAVLDFQLDGIREGLKRRPDLTRKDLLSFYQGLEDVFRPEALRRLSEVEAFHESLVDKRRARLERERLHLERSRREVAEILAKKGRERDRLLARLRGTTAIEEYTSMTVRLADLREEKASIERFLNHQQQSELDKREVRGALLDEDARTSEYLKTHPDAALDEAYRKITKRLYPKRDAGIVLKQNSRENKLRYNIEVQLQGQGSDGINGARIMCFDWLVYAHGAHHNMNFLWHDSRLFAHMDPKQRAVWFRFVIEELQDSSRSYVATLNAENFASLQPHLPPEVWEHLREAVVLELSGGEENQKLLGRQFEGS